MFENTNICPNSQCLYKGFHGINVNLRSNSRFSSKMNAKTSGKKVNKWVKICKKWSQGDLRIAKNQSGSCKKAV